MKLSVENINVELGNKKIVHNACITVNKGEFVGLIGPNGSGKSTLLKTIYRICKPKSGAIYLDGKNLLTMPIKDMARELGVVSQFNHIAFDIKVEDMVLMGRSPHKKMLEQDNEQDYKIAREMLEKVDMLNYAKRSFSTLSGGEKQRVLLARTLAQQVELLILDEPTNHLDIKYQIQILNLVKSLKTTAVVALHDLNLAAAYCDKLYVMHNGNVVANGEPKDILTSQLIKEVYEVDCKIHVEQEPMYITFKTV
ncbi:ABC transporter [Clostridium tetani]|uniref:ABC transporter n=1 Tax=Clostridium tetani TaxID=1513 RepID=A0A4Q0V0F2_CLOTA|nr:ABC transporter ATP-binding protein [Clostridium tetani]CDI49026.1 hemin transport system ATP-binding protein fecE [Clostridium tetani 12124569]KGI40443.1 ABC transporter [Clostridium tetani ATCC 9441]KGI42374.1 ABC transporter [Clostridium tetani]KHO39583.1 ABC transporter [Clostridium tetani]RXI38579.1 ABC transporter ATP-binding protein [Clostridium tetani]